MRLPRVFQMAVKEHRVAPSRPPARPKKMSSGARARPQDRAVVPGGWLPLAPRMARLLNTLQPAQRTKG